MNNQEQVPTRTIVIFGSHTEVSKYYFTVPADVSLEEFKENPWIFNTGQKVVSLEDGEIDVDDADEQFGGAA